MRLQKSNFRKNFARLSKQKELVMRINSRSFMRLCVAVSLMCIGALYVAAQPVQPKYKEGDRVEFSMNGACLGEQFAVPAKGTILQVNTGTAMNYVVQVDPLPGQAP